MPRRLKSNVTRFGESERTSLVRSGILTTVIRQPVVNTEKAGGR
jgi:hypothetical protein